MVILLHKYKIITSLWLIIGDFYILIWGFLKS